jgi:plasmid stabilization system protein ParE
LSVHDEVEFDVDEAALWYQAEGGRELADDFLAEVQATLERILEGPEKYQAVHANVRRAPMRRFPYGVYFRCDGSLRVHVVAVVSLERRPLHWTTRL